MINNLISILLAIVVIIIAGILVSWWDVQKKISKDLGNKITDNLGEFRIEYFSLTGEEIENDFFLIEEQMIKLNKHIQNSKIKKPNTRKEKNKHVKYKKNFTNN